MRFIRRFALLFLMLTLLLGAGTGVLAASSSILYEGGADKFVFLPDGKNSGRGLFGDGFRGVMPGDTVTQEIVIKNNFLTGYSVNLYLRALPHGEENPLSSEVAAKESFATMEDFLSKLSLTVKQGEKVLFDASPDKLGGLKDNILLGSFARGEKTSLTVELKVPAELGNEYAERIGEVDWVFTAEQVPQSNPDDPKTGDSAQIGLYAALACVALIGCVVLLRKRKS